MAGRRNQVGHPLAVHQTVDHRKMDPDHHLVVAAAEGAVYHRVGPMYLLIVFLLSVALRLTG